MKSDRCDDPIGMQGIGNCAVHKKFRIIRNGVNYEPA